MAGILSLPDGFELLEAPAVRAVVRTAVKDELLALGVLDEAKLEESRAAGRPIRSGRGGAVSVALAPDGNDRAVIRHCRRAGPLGRILGDKYICGARPMEELAVCEAARAAGVSAPECLAAVVHRAGLFYSGDLIVREVPDAVTLDAWLRDGPAPGPAPGSVRAVAGVFADAFARLAAAGIYHPDLHAGNVLLRENDAGFVVWIIDFDKAKLLDPLPAALRDRMLFRFNRALVKRSLAPRPVTLAARIRFCRRAGVARAGEEMHGFATRCAAHLKRHSWRY